MRSKKVCLIIAGLILIGGNSAIAQNEGADAASSISPPPVRGTNLQGGTLGSNNAAFYATTSQQGVSFNMLGLASESVYGIKDWFAITLNGTGMYGAMQGSMGGSDIYLNLGIGSLMVNGLFSIVKSEKRNTIGEITSIGHGLSAFAGGGLTYLGLGLRDEPETFRVAGWGTMYQVQTGLIGEIYIIRQLQLVPYVYAAATGGSVTVLFTPKGGISQSVDADIPPATIIAYGGDIVIRPSSSNPRLKISLGTLLQQISTNSNGMLFLMFGLSYEFGARYEEMSIGPVLQ